jgi:hypothetical protein
LSGFDTLDWTPPLLWLWQRRHDREVILCPSPSGLVVHALENNPLGVEDPVKSSSSASHESNLPVSVIRLIFLMQPPQFGDR